MRIAKTRVGLVSALILLLQACGGGGGGGGSSGGAGSPAATPLPTLLTISLAGAEADVAAPVQFENSAAGLTGLRHEWNFVDGSSSTEARPTHGFAKPGDYEVRLRILNARDEAKTVTLTVAVNNKATVRDQICSGANQSGWCFQSPLPAGHIVTQPQLLTAQLGWAQAGDRRLIKTTDGGRSWKVQPIGSSGKLERYVFTDANLGWALGTQGQVWRSTDGGQSWAAGTNVPFTQLDSDKTLEAFGTQLLRVGNAAGERFASLDAGASWSRISSPAYLSVTTAAGLVFARTSENNILRSTDLGLSFSAQGSVPQDCPGSKASNRTDSLLADGESALLLSGWADLIAGPHSYSSVSASRWFCRSTDGGKTWRVAAGKGLPERDYINYGTPGLWLVEGVLWFDWGQLYRSTDGGENWAPVSKPDLGSLTLTALGASAVMLTDGRMSVDAGQTWSALPGRPVHSAKRLDAQTYQLMSSGRAYLSSNAGQIWIPLFEQLGDGQTLGSLGAIVSTPANALLAFNGAGLLQSFNAGQTWSSRAMFPFGNSASLQFASATRGWLIAGYDELFRTLDGGVSWSRIWSASSAAGLPPFSLQVSALQFFDESNGWLALQTSDFASEIRQSRDGGQTWSARPELPLAEPALLGLDAETLLAGGRDGAIHALGASGEWKLRFRLSVGGAIKRLVRQDAQRLWAVGSEGLLLSSSDGGQSWSKQDTGVSTGLNDIRFADDKHGWIVGNAGLVLATPDGGKTWQRQESATSDDLLSLVARDAKTGWIVGSWGTVLATGTGGF